MRIFHELILDEVINDTDFHTCKAHWTMLSGVCETLRVMAVVDRVSGSSPTFYMGSMDTPDDTWKRNFCADIISVVPLTVGQSNVLRATAGTSATPPSYGFQLLVALGGGSPKAHVRIWLTGRGMA